MFVGKRDDLSRLQTLLVFLILNGTDKTKLAKLPFSNCWEIVQISIWGIKFLFHFQTNCTVFVLGETQMRLAFRRTASCIPAQSELPRTAFHREHSCRPSSVCMCTHLYIQLNIDLSSQIVFKRNQCLDAIAFGSKSKSFTWVFDRQTDQVLFAIFSIGLFLLCYY